MHPPPDLTELPIIRVSLAAVTIQTNPCRVTIVSLLLLAISAQVGCHRQYYRRQASNEAHCLIDEKSGHVSRPPIAPLRIDIDPRSRMFNPFDPDFQPMPLDDPSSHRYMQCVDGRRGYPMWKAAGITNAVENPEWYHYLPLNEDGVLVLDADTSVRIALMHSPDYQRQLEQLFLSALDVSSERFRFDTQFFGGASTVLTADGPNRTGLGNSSTTLAVGPFSSGRRPLALQRSFATGGDLVVGVANSIVWELSGPNSQSATTVLDFALLQPLLRNAGRDKVLERLTLSERRLLSNVRAFERYRRSFYLSVVTGRNVESQVQRSGGVFGVGLGGFTGLGSGFSGLGGGGGGAGGGGGVPQAGGFIGLLQDQLQIRNLEENNARLRENLVILEDSLVELLTTIPDDPEEIIRQRLQVAQARSALLNAQSQLISRQADYQGSIDTFLGTLGLPPYICTVVEDPILERFELIDRLLRSRREQLIEVRNQVGAINIALLGTATTKVEEVTGLPQSQLVWSSEVADRIAKLRAEVQPLAEFNKKLIDDDLPRIAKDLEQFADSLPERREQNSELLEMYRREQQMICSLLNVTEIDESIFDVQRLDELITELQQDYAELETRLAAHQTTIETLDQTLQQYIERGPGTDDPLAIASDLRVNVVLASQDLLAEISDDVLSLQLIQARARTESVLLPKVSIEPATALEIARRNRRDWANARASLVDSWRLIEFNADDLESSLDVVFSGDVQNVGNNPADLRTSTGRLRVGLQWDAPITRLQERNTYRQSLIDYEQAKRSYYSFEDDVWQLIRGEVRQLQANRLNFEIGRQSVRIAATQLELNEDIRSLRDARGLSSGPTAARDTVQALNDLLNSQNQLLNIFVNYEVVRRSLDLDLGTMQLTSEGLWIDPGPISPESLLALEGTRVAGMIDCGGNCCLPLEQLPSEPIFGSAGEMLNAAELQQLTSEIRLDDPDLRLSNPSSSPSTSPNPGELQGTFREDTSGNL